MSVTLQDVRQEVNRAIQELLVRQRRAADDGVAEHEHAGEDITSGTIADARIASTIARDSEVTSAISASEASQVRDGDAAGGVLGGTYPNPSFAADMATQAELDAHINDSTDAHDASAISSVAAGNLSSTDVQAALNELDTDKQPLDSDLTAIAALATTSFGRALLELANAAALGALVDSIFLTPAEGNAAYQPLDADLTLLAALQFASQIADKVVMGTSAGGVQLTDVTGTGNFVRAGSPAITTPTIASFTNATHSHQNAAGGGTLDAAAIGSGTLGASRGGTGATSATGTAGSVVLSNSPTIVTPTIASLVNATHNHQNAAGGGTLDHFAVRRAAILGNFDLAFWEGRTEATSYANGDPVGTVTDSSAAASNWTAATTARPTWTSTGGSGSTLPNGFPFLRFDGTSDTITRAARIASNAMTFIAVLRNHGGGTGYRMVLTTDNHLLAKSVTANEWGLYNGSDVTYGEAMPNAWHVFVWQIVGTGYNNYNLSRASLMRNLTTAGASQAKTTTCIGSNAAAAQFADIDCAAFACASSALTAAQIAAAVSYFRDVYHT